MLSCEQVLQGLREFLDREMKAGEEEHVKKHLDLCRSCFSRLEFETKLRDEMRKKTNHCCPDQLKARIKSLLDLF